MENIKTQIREDETESADIDREWLLRNTKPRQDRKSFFIRTAEQFWESQRQNRYPVGQG